jgi:glycine/D-amino acid oxidase-like deaminating enzyme
MPTLLVVGAGLFGSQAAAYARSKGVEALVFDAGLSGAASPAAAGLFKEDWAGTKLREHYHRALPLLDRLYGVGHVQLADDVGRRETFLFVPPTAILERNPARRLVTAVGDGWVEAEGRRYEGWVYVAAGIWCKRFLAGLDVHGKAGSAFVFEKEREGRIHQLARGRQVISFVRDRGTTYFSDGTAEREYTREHERETLRRAAAMGLTGRPVRRCLGYRPYTPRGPVFVKLSSRTWLATGGRKMGTVLGASFARRLVEEELR